MSEAYELFGLSKRPTFTVEGQAAASLLMQRAIEATLGGDPVKGPAADVARAAYTGAALAYAAAGVDPVSFAQACIDARTAHERTQITGAQ